MLEEQVVDSVAQVRDSIWFPASLVEEVSRMPLPPLDTISDYVGLVEGTPLKGWDIHFTSGILIYMVVFLVLVAWLRLQGRGFLLSVYFYFFSRKKDAAVLSEGTRQNYAFIFLSIWRWGLRFSRVSLSFFQTRYFIF